MYRLSVVLSVVFVLAASCEPPFPHGAGAERLSGPSTGYTDSTYRFHAHINWSRTWASGHFAWGDGGGEFVPVSTGDTTFSDTNSWHEPGRYRVMAQMQDSKSTLSEWSDSVFITIDTAPH